MKQTILRPSIKFFDFILVVLLITCLAACGNSRQEQNSPTVELPGDNIVLATVNAGAITQYDLEQSIADTLGAHAGGMLDEAGRQKLLEALVMGRAIAQVQEQAMSAEQTAVLAKKTAAFREQLLIKMYLAQNSATEPVTQEMVQTYYQNHPEQFGGKTVRGYELISSSRAVLSDQQRESLLAALKDAPNTKDWPALVEELKKQGLAVRYAGGQVDPNVLQPQLRDLMRPLKAGQSSALTLIDGVPHLVRITAENKIPPQPLSQVSARIRKMLLPVQLKKALQQAGEQVLKQAQVQYMK